MKRFSFFLIPVLLLLVLFVAAPQGTITFERGEEAEQVEGAARELPKAFATFEYRGESGKDAFTLLKENAEVEFEQFDFGVLVRSINGDAATDDRFWLYYVNGDAATVGADSYQTQDGDTILWRLEERTL